MMFGSGLSSGGTMPRRRKTSASMNGSGGASAGISGGLPIDVGRDDLARRLERRAPLGDDSARRSPPFSSASGTSGAAQEEDVVGLVEHALRTRRSPTASANRRNTPTPS